MYKQTVFTFLALIGITINAQTINLRGNVSNQNDEPVSGAIVELVGQALADTTNSNGEYSITKNLVSVLPSLKPETDRISLNRGILEFRLSKSSPVEVKIFDVKGNLLTKESVQRASEGIYQINLSEKNFASNLLIIQAKSGTNFETFRYLPLYNNKYLLNSPNGILTQQSSNLSKIAAGFDSLRVTAEGYNQKTIEVSSYDTIVDITLEQVNCFAGNMLEVKSRNGTPLTIMSSSALKALTFEQENIISTYSKIISSDLQTIEKNGGGSARCMIAEIFY